MSKKDKALLMAVCMSVMLAISIFCTILVVQNPSGELPPTFGDIASMIALDVAHFIIIVMSIVVYVKHKGDKPPVKPLASFTGTLLGGLPYPTKEFVDIMLYPEKFEFLIHTREGILDTKRERIVLNLEKVQRVRKIYANIRNTVIITRQFNTTTIQDNSGFFGNEDMFVIDYISDNGKARITIGIPTLASVSKMLKEFEKLKPQSNQPIEL